MKFISVLSGGPFDGLRFETVIPLSSIVLTAESIGERKFTEGGTPYASVTPHTPASYETWRIDHEDGQDVRQMSYTGETLPE